MTNDDEIIALAKEAGFFWSEKMQDILLEADDERPIILTEPLLKFAQLLLAKQWISSNDKLPDLGVKVICIKDRSKRNKATIVEQDFRSLLSRHDNHWLNTPSSDKVTFWMPLPAPPTLMNTDKIEKGEV